MSRLLLCLPFLAMVCAVPASASCPTDGCFCCNNCFTNYFFDMPTGQSAEALYRQEDYEGCIEKSAQIKTPTAYQKVVHAKCLEGAGQLDQAATMYRELLAGDPQGAYPPAREAKERLATLAQASKPKPRSPSAWPSLASPQRVGGGERDAAVVVGISESFVLPKIAGAAENATDWYRSLTAGLGVPPEKVTLLRNGEATREAILEAATRAARAAADGGRVWFIFIGHGAPAPSGDDGLLLGADAQATEASLTARGVPQREVYAALRSGRAASVVAIIDACFSGSTPDGAQPLVAGSQATVPVRRADVEDRLVVLSSSERIAGPLPRGNRPAFSYLALGALQGWADVDRDRKVTALEVLRYTEGVLRATVTDRDQTPRLQAKDRNVVLARSAGAGAPDVVAIVAGSSTPY